MKKITNKKIGYNNTYIIREVKLWEKQTRKNY